jgi:hypothetical protein
LVGKLLPELPTKDYLERQQHNRQRWASLIKKFRNLLVVKVVARELPTKDHLERQQHNREVGIAD